MEVNEQIVTGQKFRCLMDEAAKLWQRISFWTKANDVEFDDGMNAETKVGAISGITDSLARTSSHIAASAKAVHTLNNNFSSITTPGSISAFAYSDLAGVYHDTNLNDLKTPGFYSVGNSQFAASEKNMHSVDTVPTSAFSAGIFTEIQPTMPRTGLHGWNTPMQLLPKILKISLQMNSYDNRKENLSWQSMSKP